MWVARIKMWHAGSASIELTKKYSVNLTVQYLNSFYEDGKAYINRVMIVEGSERKEFTRDFVEEEGKRANILEVEGNQIFYSIKSSDQYHSLMLGSKVFFVKPIFLNNGFEEWTVGSHDKKHITQLAKRINLTGTSTAEIISLKQEKPKFHSSGLLAQLTETQRAIFNLACKEGYYQYPRQANLNALAKKAGLSKTATRAALRRAEKKVLTTVHARIE